MWWSGIPHLRILGHLWTVKYVDAESAPAGNCSFEDHTIEIKASMAESEKAETLLHEIIHAVDLSTATNGDTLTEGQVRRISALLYAVLADNDMTEGE